MPRKMARPDDDDGFINPVDDPEGVQRAIDAALASSVDKPELAPPPDTLITLPCGLVRGDQVVTQVEVRELTGEHEETLARAIQAQPGSIVHFVNVLLECGTVRFGTEDPAKTPELLKQALVGDRDALVMGIRRATYGDTIDIEGWQCPECGNDSDLAVPLSDIPVRVLEHPVKDISFDVPLRRGRTAEMRLANGADQSAVFENPRLTLAERDTILLGRCLLAVRDKDGTRHIASGLGGSIARSLSLPDRHAILRQLVERQPGPQMSNLKITHQACGKEVSLGLGLADLFRDLVVA